ncbi:sphingomyelin phosphodiesterase 4 [Uranotaenia lowii]|uniref:sphingomyelin phosphodiesterase 4 n=1 Tax=Uranotaenia lowii TaxID=190385 RepID=UPI002479855A|nr:sphingomyelin phosphodiesterase 4 [Uranotaenia lowii]
MDSPGVRILEILSLPPIMRCPELGLLIDRASLKELQDIYPIVINSIFGINSGSGWGFRIMTRDTHPHDFDVLYNFFIPIGGPMFRLCYRLLNDSLKYELPMSFLPPKMQQMIESGRHSTFYSDLINIDPFRRQIVSLSLNAFDYFLFHFALHGNVPLQRLCPAAMNPGVHEKAKTLYLILTAEYLCTFLPSHPDSIVLPQIVCGSAIKLPSPTVMPVMQPTKSPKYLLLSALHHHAPTTAPNASMQQRSANTSSALLESSRTHCWRSESALHIFIDCWLRLDIDDSRELPSNEFIRCVRILVKQLHAFGNSGDLDNSSMALLRQSAQPLMNARMFSFLKSLMARWPLDSSFSDVLELWLSYVQPWRYTFNRDLSSNADLPITQRHETFIGENLISYTQIFVQLIPRFERMDLTTLRNVLMLFRLLKVFSQGNLIELLSQNEAMMSSNNNVSLNNSPFNASPTAGNISGASNRSGANMSTTGTHNRSGGGGEWKTFSSPGRPGTPGNRSTGEPNEDSYVFLFGEHFGVAIEELLKKIYVSMLIAKDNLRQLQQEKENRYQGVLRYLHKLIGFFDQDPVYTSMLNERSKIPEILDVALQILSRMFQIPLTDELFGNESMDVDAPSLIEQSTIQSSCWNSTMGNSTANSSLSLSPQHMKTRQSTLQYTGDPALLPIRANEFTFLVRFLHQLSSKLNLMFGQEMDLLWNRQDLWGKLSRQVLCPPMVAQIFDKSQGYCVLVQEPLGPRLNLRMLASHKSAFVVVCSFFLGYLFFNAPSYGFMLLVSVTFIYLLIRSMVCDLSKSTTTPFPMPMPEDSRAVNRTG